MIITASPGIIPFSINSAVEFLIASVNCRAFSFPSMSAADDITSPWGSDRYLIKLQVRFKFIVFSCYSSEINLISEAFLA
jgi:hypothetical protein